MRLIRIKKTIIVNDPFSKEIDLKINKVAIVSKFGAKKSEHAPKKIAKELLDKHVKVFTIYPVLINNTRVVDTVENLQEGKLDFIITLGGDGTTLRTFRNLSNDTPLLTINVGGNRGILSEITLNQIDNALKQIAAGDIWLDRRTRVVAS
mgnify:CR=1 FL=1